MPGKKPSRTSYSLRGQLGILFAALAVPLLLLQGYWSYHDYRGARERAWDDALAFADAVDLGLRQFMEQSEELLRASARLSGADWIHEGECGSDLTGLRDLLPFENVLLVDTAGGILCSAAEVGPGASAAAWPWFDDFMARGDFIVAPAAEADFSGGWILPLVAPVRDESGMLLGGLVGTIPLEEISALLRSIRPGGDHLITVTSADSIVVARSSDADVWVGRGLPPPSGSDRLVGPGRWVAEGPDLTGVSRTWGQVRTESGWLVYVGVPDDLVLGPARRQALVHVGATLLIVLLGVLLAGVSYARIASALKELAEHTRLTGSEVLSPPPRTPSEITEVVQKFNDALRARTRAESAERHARERFQSLFDNAVFGLCVADETGAIVQANRALARMLAYPSADALMGVDVESLYVDPSRHHRLLGAAHDGDASEPVELHWKRLDGTAIIVRAGATFVDGHDGGRAMEVIVEDVTNEVRNEEQLRQKQKLEAIGELAGGIAHDFNNLLTVIGGNVELLRHDLPGEAGAREDLAQISKATRRAASLTRRLLTFSRRTNRGKQILDVNTVLIDLGKMLDPLIGEPIGLLVETEERPAPIVIDPGELEQLVVNLVLNARDAITGDGRIAVAVTLRTPEEDGSGEEVVVTVEDDGSGMDEATQRRMFDPFFTTKPRGEGTGLGLSTVYGIVERAGGALHVESEPGRGTRIEVRLPAAVGPPTAVESGAGDVVGGTETILVAEDDDLVRSFVRRALAASGYGVRAVGGAEEALAVLEHDAGVDLVLTDVIMPGLSGPQLAERIASDFPDTPVVFMSGYIDNPLVDADLARLPDRLLRKPFSPDELRAFVRQALDSRAVGAAPP